MQISLTTLFDDLTALEQSDFSKLSPPTFLGFDGSKLNVIHVSDLPLLAQGVIMRKVLQDEEGVNYRAPSAEDVSTPRIKAILEKKLTHVFTGSETPSVSI